MKKIFILVLVFSLCFVNTMSLFAREVTPLEVNLAPNSKAAILMDYATGDILYNKNINEKRAVASLTKMMGLIIIFEDLKNGGITEDEIITVSYKAKEMGGSQIWLEEGEKISVSDLLKGIIMASANDGMVALAERVAGTEDAFVKLMNEKAKLMGLKNTNFINSTGLDEEGAYSTAYDMALIAKELLSFDKFLTYSSVYEDYIRNGTANRTWISNTNKLVRFYDGADGLKTGFTEEALSCMAVTAKRSGLRLITITLGYNDSKIRNSETMDLLDYGFNQYKARVLYEKGSVVGVKLFDKIDKGKISFVASRDVTILSEKGESDKNYTYEIIQTKEDLPIKKGDVIGTLYVKEGNTLKITSPLVSLEDVNKIGFLKLYWVTLKAILG